MKLFFYGVLFSVFMTNYAIGQNRSLEDRFKQIDRNNDGKVTADELPRKDLFKRFDRNKDGVISIDEVTRRNRNPAGNKTETSEIEKKLDISYGEDKTHRLDIYRPAKAVDCPAMVYVHGGGWMKGDKSSVAEKPVFFCKHGWIFVSINYRLLPSGQHPSNAKDVARAVSWVNDNIKKYNGDPTQIFLMGHSAGAHLASLAATDEKYFKDFQNDLSIIKGVISLDTNAYDIPNQMAKSNSPLYPKVFSKNPETWRDASPITHVESNKKIPPFLICYSRGMQTRVNPQRSEQANAFANRLIAENISAQVIDASDRNHGEINKWFGKTDDEKVTGKALSFLKSLTEKKQSHPK